MYNPKSPETRVHDLKDSYMSMLGTVPHTRPLSWLSELEWPQLQARYFKKGRRCVPSWYGRWRYMMVGPLGVRYSIKKKLERLVFESEVLWYVLACERYLPVPSNRCTCPQKFNIRVKTRCGVQSVIVRVRGGSSRTFKVQKVQKFTGYNGHHAFVKSPLWETVPRLLSQMPVW